MGASKVLRSAGKTFKKSVQLESSKARKTIKLESSKASKTLQSQSLRVRKSLDDAAHRARKSLDSGRKILKRVGKIAPEKELSSRKSKVAKRIRVKRKTISRPKSILKKKSVRFACVDEVRMIPSPRGPCWEI